MHCKKIHQYILEEVRLLDFFHDFFHNNVPEGAIGICAGNAYNAMYRNGVHVTSYAIYLSFRWKINRKTPFKVT